MRFYLLIIVSSVLVSCSNVKHVKTTFNTGVKKEEYTVLKKDTTLKHGVYRRYDENGDLRESCNYVQGQLDGKRNIFFPDGTIEISETHREGSFHGAYVSYYRTGHKREEGMYKDNEMTGLWKFYYDLPGDALKEEVTFENNMENGPFREYHPNGELAAEGTYKDELEHGLTKVWDSTGFLIKEILYDNGRPLEYQEYTRGE